MFKIKNHKTLNPKLWLPDNSLRPEVAEMLNRIYISLMTVLSLYSGFPLDLEHDIIDVILCGSSKEYSYNKNSDIDITIILRPDRYLKRIKPEVFEVFIKFIRNFFIYKYSPKINGKRVDIGFAPVDFDFARYSLVQKKWLKEPTRLTDKEMKEVQYKANKIYKEMRKEIISLLRDKSRYAEITKIMHKLKMRRTNAWNGSLKDYLPFSSAYSCINRSGLIQKMLDANDNMTKKLMMGKLDK
ncbi:MAG: nucleotidyltransferase domain-containing protein [Alphaproteobacteria bacterium]|nr:nucleotidyltransferase domain-containing protein [Alphaproteobacteria bacterium]MBN2675045.1 nucleotidyltransferase domain-containing protein [Alphaproteobacteria bacterium]